jgi:hypothetical protein
MKIDAYIPLEITITSYYPGTPGRYGGPPEDCYPAEAPEVEFTIKTLSGQVLGADDFDSQSWSDLYDTVLDAVESKVDEARGDAQIDAWEDYHATL